MIHPNYGKAGDYTPEELRNLRAHYCAEAELVDRWVGRVLRKIDDLDLWKNSLVIFTTDHGMSLGEHNRTGKSNINKGDPRFWPTYPEIAHIPCLIAGPGLPAGRAVDAFVQPMDLLPTILDLAGVTVQPPEPFHGRSFAELARGKRARWERDFVVTAAHLRKKEDGRIPPKAVTPMIYTRKWACAPIGAEGAPELFDLETDPLAERNLAARRPKLVKELRAKLIGWLKEIGSPAEAISALK
jgi:arylsulfatase A-like enzyme